MNSFLDDCAADILRKYDNNDAVCTSARVMRASKTRCLFRGIFIQ